MGVQHIERTLKRSVQAPLRPRPRPSKHGPAGMTRIAVTARPLPTNYLVQQVGQLQQSAGNSAVSTLVQRAEVQIQRNKKENVVAKGFTDAEAESLKTIIGGWVAAAKLVEKDDGVTPQLLRAVMADHSTPMVRKLALENLSEHYYGVAKHLCSMAGVDFAGLIKKGVNNKTVDVMTGYPVPVFRATILSLIAPTDVKDISSLGRIFSAYPSFDAVVQANLQGDPKALDSVIRWLGSISLPRLRYLERNTPSFAVLKLLTQHSFDNDDLLLLAHYSKDNPPGNDDYEYRGQKGKRQYRVGHFSRFHTIRGMSSANPLPATKTIWPVATTVDGVRDICGEFDDNTKFSTSQRYYYTPNLVPVRIAVDAHGSSIYKPSMFDQMYPTSGPTVGVTAFSHLQAVVALKNNWTEP